MDVLVDVAVADGPGVLVAVPVGVAVALEVLVAVALDVLVSVGVAVALGVLVGVPVGVVVAVAVGGFDVLVAVPVGVAVLVGELEAADVEVVEGVEVGTNDAEAVAVTVAEAGAAQRRRPVRSAGPQFCEQQSVLWRQTARTARQRAADVPSEDHNTEATGTPPANPTVIA